MPSTIVKQDVMGFWKAVTLGTEPPLTTKPYQEIYRLVHHMLSPSSRGTFQQVSLFMRTDCNADHINY